MDETRQTVETKAAELGERVLEWNELDFVGWKAFRRMAPAVIGLETARLERVLADCEPGSGEYNALVRARFEMRAFAEGLEGAGRSELPTRADHLGRALLALALPAQGSDTVRYVARRLEYVHKRLRLVY